MAEKLDSRQVVTFEELLRAMMMEQDATRRILVRKGLLTNEEVLEEIKAVRTEMEGKRGPDRRQSKIVLGENCEDCKQDEVEDPPNRLLFIIHSDSVEPKCDQKSYAARH